MSLEKKIHLQEGEEIVEAVRPYILTYFGKYLIGFIVMAAASFFTFRLFSFGWWGYLVYGVSMVLGLYIIIWGWFMNYTNVVVVTNQRLVDIDRSGWVHEVVSPVSFSEISDIFIRKQGFLAHLFNYGTLVVQTKSDSFVLEAPKIHKPQQLHTLLTQVRQQGGQGSSPAGPTDNRAVYQSFVKAIPSLSEGELQAVRELIDDQLTAEPEPEPEPEPEEEEPVEEETEEEEEGTEVSDDKYLSDI